MPCASCKRHQLAGKNLGVTDSTNKYPFTANDISVIDSGQVRRFQADDWNNDRIKLLIFVPEVASTVASTELNSINAFYDRFLELNTEVIVVGTQSSSLFADWYATDPTIEPKFKTFCSYLLPQRLTLTENGRAKHASAFISPTGEITKSEYFETSPIDIESLYEALKTNRED